VRFVVVVAAIIGNRIRKAICKKEGVRVSFVLLYYVFEAG
jgi:hypothetical protein